MFLKIKKIVGASAGAVLVMTVFAGGILENTYITYPRSPDPQHGRIVPHEIKGVIVYITKTQYDLLFWVSRIEIGSAAIAVLVLLINRENPFNPKK